MVQAVCPIISAAQLVAAPRGAAGIETPAEDVGSDALESPPHAGRRGLKRQSLHRGSHHWRSPPHAGRRGLKQELRESAASLESRRPTRGGAD